MLPGDQPSLQHASAQAPPTPTTDSRRLNFMIGKKFRPYGRKGRYFSFQGFGISDPFTWASLCFAHAEALREAT